MLPNFIAVFSVAGEIGAGERNRWAEALRDIFALPLVLSAPRFFMASAVPPRSKCVGQSEISLLGSLKAAQGSEPDLFPQLDSDREILEAIVTNLWGAYVAIITGGGDGSTTILRNPSGSPAIYYYHDDEKSFVSNEIRLIEQLCRRPHSIDVTGLVGELLYPTLRGRRTALEGVRELLPGEALQLAQSGWSLRTIWSPARYLDKAREPVSNVDDASVLVRNAVSYAVTEMCRDFESILVNLSGGLDSSILASVANGCADDMTLLNLTSTTGLGDEREFAQIVADHLQHRLEVRSTGIDQVDVRASAAANRPRPTARSFAQSLVTQTMSVARQSGSKAIVHGHGGDNVFCYIRSASPAAERLGRGFLRTVADVAAVTDCSIPHIARKALEQRIFGRDPGFWSREETFLTEDVKRLPQDALDHPWLVEQNRLSVGKQAHVRAIMIGLAYTDYLDVGEGIPILYPLLSQPVIETCLRVPAWMWFDGGINRAPARRAFQEALPRSIIERMSKGALGNFARAIYRANFNTIREMLLEGYLVRAGVVDAAELETALGPGTPAHDTTYLRLLRMVDLEAWIHHRGSDRPERP